MTDVEFHNIDVLCIQETHNTDEINEKVISVRNRKYHYINLCCQNRFHGLGFIVRSGLVYSYQKLHDRIGLVTLELSKNNKKSKVYIYNIYSPWKYQDPKLDIVYNILNSEIKTNTECKFLCGDFNCTIGDSNFLYPNHIGAF